jgi:hypothetical protein
MKLAALLLLTLGLILGVVGAATAYNIPLALDDARLQGVTIIAPAGRVGEEGTPGRPIVSPGPEGTPLTPELLAELRAGNVVRVRVKEFSFARWSGRWFFLGGCVLLLGGAFLVRRSAKQEAQQQAASGQRQDPALLLQQITAEVNAIREALRQSPTWEARQALILSRVEALQRGPAAAFAESRDALIAQGGFGRYASIIERFAAAERQIARSWSAAADGYEAESLECLDFAAERLAETASRMR